MRNLREEIKPLWKRTFEPQWIPYLPLGLITLLFCTFSLEIRPIEKRGRITNNYFKSSEVNWSCNISGGVLFISHPRSHVYDVEIEHLFHPDKSSNPKNQTPRTTYCLRDGKHLYGILIWLPINKIMSPTHATYYLHLRCLTATTFSNI